MNEPLERFDGASAWAMLKPEDQASIMHRAQSYIGTDIVKTVDLTEWERLAIETFAREMMRSVSGSDRVDRSFGPVRCLFEPYSQLAEKVKTHGR